MTLPPVTLNSVTIAASTHQRLGADYLAGSNTGQWRIGAASIWVHAVGLLPFKDTFLSNATQQPPSHSNTGKPGSGGFKGFRERAPALHAAAALLSAGPVSPSDGVGGSDVALLKSLCRADGMLLKPDKPARSVDAQWLSSAFPLRHMAAAPQGYLATTATVLAGWTWGFILVAEAASAQLGVTAEYLGLPGGTASTQGVAWARPKAVAAPISSIVPFDATSPLRLPATATEYSDDAFALVSTAPRLPNGFVVLGEAGKMVGFSRARFADIDISATSVTLHLRGAPRETVIVAYLRGRAKQRRPTSTDLLAELQHATCQIAPDGEAACALH